MSCLATGTFASENDLSLIIVYGGTFDPPHLAHLGVMQAALQQLPEARLLLLPCYMPVHKARPGASAAHRLGMLSAMLAAEPQLMGRVQIDDRELQAESPRYTVDTLAELRAELGSDQPLAFLMGGDSLQGLSSWQRWRELTNFCHLLVYPRPGYALPQEGVLGQFLAGKWLPNQQCARLAQTPFGQACLLSGTLMPAASREIRAGAASMHSSVPKSVLKYIEQYSLYQNS
ncbi:nicotinate-nucleotide adenylyltransferase [Salinispirillum sp. LH 10-3-1]|uniref:Probable nicotinate-nucleotide adenylyltransferase n=1 Tax=Salinispirillum sp. LH 10-3-1 TaxID=2952525 RepID=A0AB38YKQ3_9GAMM